MLIKTKNFSLSHDKQNGTFDGPDGLGWAPGYETKTKGVGLKNNIVYDKNYQLMKGICRKCKDFVKTNKMADGSHCKLEACKF